MTASFIFKSYEDNKKKKPQKLQKKKIIKMLKKFLKHKTDKKYKEQNGESLKNKHS